LRVSSAGRRGLGFTLLLSFVVLVLAPSAAGQTGQRLFDVQYEIDRPKTIVERFGSATMHLNVSVRSNQPANPLTDQATIVISVNRTQPVPVPNGWAISSITPATCSIQPDEKCEFTIDVKLTTDDPDAAKVAMQFMIHARPTFEGPLDPILGPALQNQESTTTAATEVRRELEPAEALTSFVFLNAWILAVVAVAILVVVGVLLRGRRRGGIAIATDTAVQEVVPGRGASFPIVLTNLGGTKEPVVLGTSDVPPGWSAILPLERLELQANESTTIWLTLKSPANAKPGENVQVAFIATTGDGTANETRLEANVVERYGDEGNDPPPPRTLKATRAR
jgi:hypothetical protein